MPLLPRYPRAMSNPRVRADPALSRQPDTIYRTYVAQCRRLGVKPVPMVRAKSLIREWVAELAARQDPPPTH